LKTASSAPSKLDISVIDLTKRINEIDSKISTLSVSNDKKPFDFEQFRVIFAQVNQTIQSLYSRGEKVGLELLKKVKAYDYSKCADCILDASRQSIEFLKTRALPLAESLLQQGQSKFGETEKQLVELIFQRKIAPVEQKANVELGVKVLLYVGLVFVALVGLKIVSVVLSIIFCGCFRSKKQAKSAPAKKTTKK